MEFEKLLREDSKKKLKKKEKKKKRLIRLRELKKSRNEIINL
jgi:hypothetical protein